MNNHLLISKYCANELLLKKSGSEVERLGNTLYSSRIELTPHQINAALFAFKSPLDNGVILADEVGLGKTIEAGIVIAQSKYEKNYRVLIVSPASIMKQWKNELEEKFGLDSIIMDRKQYNLLKKSGKKNPFDTENDVVICSYQMCGSFKEDIFDSNIKLAVLDEAHKLRNVHNEKSITANRVKEALVGKKKLLLTATPIQNNLMDLYGLVSIIDDNIFGDKATFRNNYLKNYSIYEDDLNDRLKMVLHRTLRKQVSHYIKFTNRIPKTFTFEQNDQEKEVYEYVRNLILNADEKTYLIPKQQSHLVTLILCKLIGSSTAAIESTLTKMKLRLCKMRDTQEYVDFDGDEYDEDYLEEDVTDIENNNGKIDLEELNKEINELDQIIFKAKSIKSDSKYQALLESLKFSFMHLNEIGAENKVIIFTESRKTQQYLYEKLLQDGYSKIVLYNGTNTDELSQNIFKEWGNNHHSELISNNKSVNMKAAILDKFKNDAEILIATEAGAEGLNLQFCSLVINYDLPWNPQKVEQRIGRCHRLGQKFDVVVINFISSSNVVEERVYELLSNKFKVFNEILGSSDSIIGSLEDGKDLENSIVNIYKTCRTEKEIDKAFEILQLQYREEIDESMSKTRKELLDNFEEDIQLLFKNTMGAVTRTIGRIEHYLWVLTKYTLQDASFNEKNKTFITKEGIKYHLIKDSSEEGNWYSLNSKLSQQLIKNASEITNDTGKIIFDISNYPYNISKIKVLKGRKGVLMLSKLTIDAIEKEEYLIFNGILDDGTRLESDLCEKLFRLDTFEDYSVKPSLQEINELKNDNDISVQAIVNRSQDRNNEIISNKINQINSWADDKIEATQLSVEEMRMQRKDLQRQSDTAVNMIEKEKIESEIIKISKKIKLSWIKLADEEEEIEQMRRKMIADIRKESLKNINKEIVFSVSFEIR